MRALLLVAAVMLTGCGEAIFGMCGPHDTILWEDPALYDAIEEDAPTQTPPTALAPMPGAPQGVVTVLRWSGGAAAPSRGSPQAELRPGTLAATATTDDEARAILRAFLANVSARPPSDGALVDAALANRSIYAQMVEGEGSPLTIWRYEAAAEGPWRVAEVVADATPQDADAPRSPGTMHARVGGYHVTVAFPVREIDVGGFTLRVDATGRAEGVVGDREGEDATTSIARMDAALHDAGLPPTRDAQVMTMIC